jgi:iron complex transport system substrate-binding protein
MSAFALPLAFSAAALKVASLDLCADEYLMMLARDEQVASVSRIGRDPLDSAVAARAKHFPPNDGSVESLLRHRPTLILTTGGGGGRSVAALARRFGIPTLALPYSTSPVGVAANMRRVAAALGDERRAQIWALRLRALQQHPRPGVDAAFLSDGGQSVAAGSLGAQWMALAGYRQRALPGGRMTLEDIALRPPAVMLLSRYRPGQVSLSRRWLSHPIVANAPSRRVVTDGRRWTCAGPLMLDEIQRLRRRP